MHHTKHAARRLAWQDPTNPFSKNTHQRKRGISSLSRAERGQSDDAELIRIRTDPTTQREAHSSSAESTNHSPQAMTAPSALSRKRPHEAGDDIGPIPATSSPAGSIHETDFSPESEKTIQENSVETATLPPYSTSRAATGGTMSGESTKKGGFVHWVKSWKSGNSDLEQISDHDNADGKHKPEPQFTVWSQFRNTILNSKINILLIASPVGIAIHYAGIKPVAVFVVNFIAIIPLAAMLSFATEEIALRVGEVLGGLLNASFGNAVELIVSIIALTKDQVLIVQTSLIGSVLSNLLLVLGMCFFAGGVNRIEQNFNMTVAQTASSLLFLAVAGLLIPTVFAEWSNTGQVADRTAYDTRAVDTNGVKQISLATSILLLVVYIAFLFFQLKSHTSMYNLASKKVEKRDMSKQKARAKRLIPKRLRKRGPAPVVGAGDAAMTNRGGSLSMGSSNEEQEEEREEPQLSLPVAIFTLCAATALVAVNAECLVDSINAVTCGTSISKSFVGLILLPIVGNAAEHATSVTVAIKDKMDLAIGVAVGSSMQIALLVLPFIVVLGAIIGKDDMTLYFDGFQLAILFVAVLLVNYLIQDGKSHWLEGVLLMILYVIIAVAAWYYPTTASGCEA